jgi:uncharacterized protein YoxC
MVSFYNILLNLRRGESLLDLNWNWLGWGFLALTAVVAFFLIRTLIQVNRTVRNLETFLDSLEKEITPLVRNLKETSESVNHILAQTQERFNQMEALFQTLKESARIFSVINKVLNGGVTSTLVNLAGLTVGVKAAGRSLFKHKTKGGK